MDRPSLPFEQIKRDVSILSVARRYGFTLKENPKDKQWHIGQCRLPMHTSRKSKTSFAVNQDKNYWLCRSSSCREKREGKMGGDVISLVRHLTGSDYYDAAQKLMEDFHVNSVVQMPAPARKPEPPKAEASAVNVPLKFAGFKDVDHGHEYLRKRGIKPETARTFGVGFYGGKSSVVKDPYRIVIPIHNAQGELVAYVGRALTPEAESKYHFPPGFHKTHELFNLHRLGDQADTVAIVEGFFGAMKVYQAGFHHVVALMGCTLSEEQEHLLVRFGRIALMLDPDKPGREAQAKLLARLAANHFVQAINLLDGQHPDSLSSDAIQKVLTPIFG